MQCYHADVQYVDHVHLDVIICNYKVHLKLIGMLVLPIFLS